ncbi:MAG: hypothetical protein R3C18_26025 [Planctomycetaceae bacterium]
MTKFACTILLCLILPAFVDGADADKNTTSAAKILKGTWEVHSIEVDAPNGGTQSEDISEFVIRQSYLEDGTYEIEVMGSTTQQGTWKILAAKENLFYLHLVQESGKAWRSMVEIVDKDTLRVSRAKPVEELDPELREIADTDVVRQLIFKRAKK